MEKMNLGVKGLKHVGRQMKSVNEIDCIIEFWGRKILLLFIPLMNVIFSN